MTHFLLSCDHIIERDSRPPKLVRCAECPKTSDGNPKRKLIDECTPDGLKLDDYSYEIGDQAARLSDSEFIEQHGMINRRGEVRTPRVVMAGTLSVDDVEKLDDDVEIVHGAELEALTTEQRGYYFSAIDCGATHADAMEAATTNGYTSVERTETSSDDVASEQSAAQIFERYRLAKDEHKQMQQWRAEHGDESIPFATPNLDGLRSDVANGVRVEDRIVRPARTTSSTPKRERKPAPQLDAGAVQFYRNGAPLRGKHNRLSSLAGYCKIPVTELRSKLAEIGVDSPETSSWELTLSTGVKLAAVVTAASES
jgi:hypothetical protein